MTDWYRFSEPLAAVALDERGFQYGDGLFETIAIRQGEPRLWARHLDRLARGCRALGFVAPNPGALRDCVTNAVADSPHDRRCCVAKLIVTAGRSQRGYGRAMPTETTVYVGISAATPLDRSAYADGVATIPCETRLATGSPLAGIKTLNRLEQVLGRSECLHANVTEGLMCDADGRLICGTMSNVFIVSGQRIRTPSLARCGVEGTMRCHLIDLLLRRGIEVDVCDITRDELAIADEVFLTNSQIGAVPVRSCGQQHWPVGAHTRAAMALLGDSGVEECAS